MGISAEHWDAAGNKGAAGQRHLHPRRQRRTARLQPGRRRGGEGHRDEHHADLRRGDPQGRQLAATTSAPAELKAILTLKSGGAGGTDIGFSVGIDTAKKVVTINPDSALDEGAVHVAISGAWFDARGNQGAAASATFTVDTTAPAPPAFDPADSATVGKADRNITLTFAEALRKDANGTELANGDLSAILTLKRGSSERRGHRLLGDHRHRQEGDHHQSGRQPARGRGPRGDLRRALGRGRQQGGGRPAPPSPSTPASHRPPSARPAARR